MPVARVKSAPSTLQWSNCAPGKLAPRKDASCKSVARKAALVRSAPTNFVPRMLATPPGSTVLRARRRARDELCWHGGVQLGSSGARVALRALERWEHVLGMDGSVGPGLVHVGL